MTENIEKVQNDGNAQNETGKKSIAADSIKLTIKVHRFTPEEDDFDSEDAASANRNEENNRRLKSQGLKRRTRRPSPFESRKSAQEDSKEDSKSAENAKENLKLVRRERKPAFGERRSSPFGERKSSSPFGSSLRSSLRSSSPFGSSRKRSGKKSIAEYKVEAHPADSILDVLLKIKRDIDPTLAFRYSCGHGMCGADAASINGTARLMCKTLVSDCLEDTSNDPIFRPTQAALSDISHSDNATSDNSSAYNVLHDSAASNNTTLGNANSAKTPSASANAGNNSKIIREAAIELAPIAGFAVIRDLIADIEPMIEQIKRFKPWLQTENNNNSANSGKCDGQTVIEFLQNPEELAKYEKLTTCISCGICESSCPVFAGGDAFAGPAALISALRFMNDSRDTAYDQRLESISETDGLPACQSVRVCSLNCPQGIDVGEEIWQAISDSETAMQESRQQ